MISKHKYIKSYNLCLLLLLTCHDALLLLFGHGSECGLSLLESEVEFL